MRGVDVLSVQETRRAAADLETLPSTPRMEPWMGGRRDAKAVAPPDVRRAGKSLSTRPRSLGRSVRIVGRA